ncbi:MAG: hypothetical protein ACKPJD_17705, partial [Planctomycetaceae bacterium]
PITSRQVIDLCSEYFNSTGVVYEGDEGADADDANLSEDQKMFERLFQDNAETYAAYESTDNCFDMTNTKRFAGDIICPDLDRTVIHRFIDYGNEDRWGKRKPDVQSVTCWLLDLLRGRVVADTTFCPYFPCFCSNRHSPRRPTRYPTHPKNQHS